MEFSDAVDDEAGAEELTAGVDEDAAGTEELAAAGEDGAAMEEREEEKALHESAGFTNVDGGEGHSLHDFDSTVPQLITSQYVDPRGSFPSLYGFRKRTLFMNCQLFVPSVFMIVTCALQQHLGLQISSHVPTPVFH